MRYREKMATKLQPRWEKEALQKGPERMEDKNAELQATIERLHRRIGL